MDKYLNFEELTAEEQARATETYKAIRAVEEQREENEIDGSGVKSCRFEREKDGYISVLI